MSEENPSSESIVLDQSYHPNVVSIDLDASVTESLIDEIIPTATLSHLPTLQPLTSEHIHGDESVSDYATPDQATLTQVSQAQTVSNSESSSSSASMDQLTGHSNHPLLLQPVIKVGVHDGRFHADEVMGVTFLKILYNMLGMKIELYRSRDPKVLEKCDIVLDVGHVYDPATRRFDHHQTSCSETFHSGTEPSDIKTIKLSSAGMTWKEYGETLVKLYCVSKYGKEIADYENFSKIVQNGYNRIYHSIVKEIDAHDNGQSMIIEAYDRPEIYRFHRNLDLGSTIAKLNMSNKSSWHTKVSNDVNGAGEESANAEQDAELKRLQKAQFTDKQFVLATELTETVVRIHMDAILEDIIREAQDLPVIEKLFNEREISYILDIPAGVSAEPKLIAKVDKHQQLLYTVYYNEHAKNWAFCTLQEPGQQFVNRKNLLSYEELAELLSPQEFSQVVFVHKALFCGAALTHDLAVKICMLSEGAGSRDTSEYDGSEREDHSTNISFPHPHELVIGLAVPVVLFTGYKVFQYFNNSA